MLARSFFAWQMIVEAEQSDIRNAHCMHSSLQSLNNALEKNSETKFISLYRLSKDAFRFLCNLLRRYTTLRSTQRVTLEAKVLCALSFYAKGEYQRIAGEANLFSQRTMSSYIKEVTDALNTPNIVNAYIKFPTAKHDRDIIKQRFNTKYGIPGVIGCIDGSHFKIFHPPKNEEHLYFYQNHYHTLNVQMICDDKCKIMAVNPKYGGATNDAFVWENSVINDFMQTLHNQKETVWLLGDSGYPLRPWLLTPYSDVAPSSMQEVFNKKHSLARVAIENTYGRLKNRWRCLSKDKVLHYKPEKCAQIIIACSVLYNLALEFNVPDPEPEYSEDDAVYEQEFHQENESNNGDMIRGRVLRDQLARSMFGKQ